MPDTKNVSVVKEQEKEFPVYQASDKEQQVVSSVFLKFRNSADERNRNFEYFDGLNLIEYIDDSVRRFVTNIDERENIEDWQARVNNQFTRNKVLAILSKVVRVLPIAQFVARGDEDFRKAQILTNLYEYAEELDDYEELMINILLEAIVKGTAIGYEGIERKTKIIKNVKGTGDNLTIKKEKEIRTNLYGAIVPLEEFYPSSVGIRNIKMMPYCFWRKQIPYQKFLMDWGMYDKSKFVQPKNLTDSKDALRPFYVDYISHDVLEGNVELIRYYNKDVDEYVIIANGIWLNPIGKEEISPIPFNHKELPFWDIKFDFFGSDFFFGKSLPDRLKSLQDVINVLTNMLLDQSFLTIFPPLLTNGFDTIEDDYLRPGRRTPIDTQGLPINQAFMKLDLGTPSGWHQYILEYTQKIMEQASVDQVSQGTAGVGERTTAQEIRIAADGVASMLGLFGRLVNYGVKRKALLKGANILQFWTDKNNPVIKRVLGVDGNKQFNNVFNFFKIDNTVLTDGKRGTKIIEMYQTKKSMPTKASLKARASLSKLESGKNVEIIAVPPGYMRDFLFDVKLVSNPKTEGFKEVEKALQLEKVRVYLSFFPQQIDVNELAAQTIEKMGDDPTKILRQDIINPQPLPEEKNTMMDKGIGTKPQGNIANNTVNGMMENGMNSQMADLQKSMLG